MAMVSKWRLCMTEWILKRISSQKAFESNIVKNRAIKFLPEWTIYVMGALPVAALAYNLVMGQVGPDPARELEHALGELALQALILGLAITPLWKLTGLNFGKYKRAIGLVAFTYVLLHLLTYVVLDYQFDWGMIWGDIIKRPYITIGMAAFVLLLPMALTSNARAIKKIGAATWKKLHKLIYIIVPLGALHWVLLTKTWQAEPIIYFLVSFALLAIRYFDIDLRTKNKRATNRDIKAVA